VRRVVFALSVAGFTLGCGGASFDTNSVDPDSGTDTGPTSDVVPDAGPKNNFGGAFETSDPGCASACLTPNSLTGTCSCSADFPTLTSLRVQHDCGLVAPYGGEISFCSGDGEGFNGAFETRAGACLTPNPMTNACSCSVGATSLDAHVMADGLATTATLCWKGTFPGAYVTKQGGSCEVANPTTGGCSCPPKSQPQAMVVVFSEAPTVGGQLVVCAPF
jgi:hypothetical protein